MTRSGPGKYSRRKVAMVKAACQFLPFKIVARLSGVPLHTLRPWMLGLAHKDVEPDPKWRDGFERAARRLFW